MLMPKLIPVPIKTRNMPILRKLWAWITSVRSWTLAEDWFFEDRHGNWIVVPKGFEFDGASIPKPLWFLLSPTGLLLIPGLVHDFAYRYDYVWMVDESSESGFIKHGEQYGQKYWDRCFYDVSQQVNQLSVINGLAWLALSLLGSCAWDKNRARNAVELYPAGFKRPPLDIGNHISIRPLEKADFEQFWPEFFKIIQAQQTYAFDPTMSFEEAYTLWCETPLKTFVAESQGVVLGSYYLKANAMGPSAHICNCGYMVSESARGQGLARILCEHSQRLALDLGFTAMQFNSVVSTNTVAVRLWEALGFKIIGTIPQAYQHKSFGLVDSYIMHKSLS